MDGDLQPISPPPQPKKSIFKNRPSWAASNTNTATHDDKVDLFNRQDDALARFTQNEAKWRKEKEAKAENRETRSGEGPRPVKKRRVNEHDRSSSDGDAPATDPKPKSPYPSKRFTFNRNLLKSPSKEESPNRAATASNKTPDKDAVVISIDDVDNDGIEGKDEYEMLEKPRLQSSGKSGPVTEVVVLEENEVDSDEEISRLAQRARERQQQQLLQSQDNGSFQPIDSVDPASPAKNKASLAIPRKQQLSSTNGPDPVLKILVHSEMPDTVPLIVQRKLSQRLKEVKTAWCTKNNIGEDMGHSISLYWRSRKLYESSTCRSLGLEVNGDGQLYFKGSEQDAGPENAQIEMEAMTPQLMEDKRRVKEQKSKPKEEEEELPETKKSEPGIKVVLRGRGYGDYKIIVRSHTPINQLVKVFRSKRNVPEDKEVFLIFDGEKLNEDESIQDTELADMDTIEVHVK